MKVRCPQPDCRHEFQVIDVDGVMSERRLISEVLKLQDQLNQLQAHVNQLEYEREEMSDHCAMLQNARDAFDRKCEKLQSEINRMKGRDSL